MKITKGKKDPDDTLCSLDSRRVFTEGMNMPVGVAFEEIEPFQLEDKYDFHTYNRKRFLFNYWKEIFSPKENDGLCFWCGDTDED